MKTITNKEKAREITCYVLNKNIANGSKGMGLMSKHNERHADIPNIYKCCCKVAIQAMCWKDEQFEKEKQQLIDKACKLMQHWILEHDYVDIMELEDYVKQKMEDEI